MLQVLLQWWWYIPLLWPCKSENWWLVCYLWNKCHTFSIFHILLTLECVSIFSICHVLYVLNIFIYRYTTMRSQMTSSRPEGTRNACAKRKKPERCADVSPCPSQRILGKVSHQLRGDMRKIPETWWKQKHIWKLWIFSLAEGDSPERGCTHSMYIIIAIIYLHIHI